MTRVCTLTTVLMFAASTAAFAQTAQHPLENQCGRNERLVWVDAQTHTYRAEERSVDFGKTGRGQFLCEGEARKRGNRPAQ